MNGCGATRAVSLLPLLAHVLDRLLQTNTCVCECVRVQLFHLVLEGVLGPSGDYLVAGSFRRVRLVFLGVALGSLVVLQELLAERPAVCAGVERVVVCVAWCKLMFRRPRGG